MKEECGCRCVTGDVECSAGIFTFVLVTHVEDAQRRRPSVLVVCRLISTHISNAQHITCKHMGQWHSRALSQALTVLTYRAIHGAEPSYFQSCFTRIADMPSRWRLCSSGSDRLHVPIIRRSTVCSRTFTASGATVWNDLLAHVTAAPSLAVFRQSLKTFLFSRSYPDIVS